MDVTVRDETCEGPEGCKLVVRRLVEQAVNLGRLEVVDTVLDPSFPTLIQGITGPESMKRVIAAYRGAVPDAHWRLSQQVADEHTVMSRFVASGTHRGPLWGVPATGRRSQVRGILISRCEAGRIVDQQVHLDLLGLLEQLGVMPVLGLQEEVIVARLLRGNEWWTSPRNETA